MAKTDTTTSQVAAVKAAVPDSFELTLDEFCVRMSSKVNAPELLGAFHYEERAAGRLKDTEAAFAKRYEDFARKPA